MISKAIIFNLVYHLGIVIISSHNAVAWQQNSCGMSRPHHTRYAGIETNHASYPRRQFFFHIARAPSITAATAAILTNPLGVRDAAAATLTVDSAKSQWKDALETLDNLLKDWPDVATKGGDAIRTKLGTQGTSSPLFQIDKVFRALRDSDYVDDFIEFQEIAEEFTLALSRADSMAYSANFAGGSGKPTPPAVYIEKSKTEVVEMQRIAKKLDALVK